MKLIVIAPLALVLSTGYSVAVAEPTAGDVPTKDQIEERKELKLSNPPSIGPVDPNAPPPVLHTEPPKKKSSNNKWFFIAGGLAIAVAFYLTTRDKKRDDEDDDDPPPPATEATAD